MTTGKVRIVKEINFLTDCFYMKSVDQKFVVKTTKDVHLVTTIAPRNLFLRFLHGLLKRLTDIPTEDVLRFQKWTFRVFCFASFV